MSRQRRHETLRAIVFDLDGTLVDSHQLAAQAYVDTLRRLGAAATTEQILATWHSGTTEQLLSRHLDRPCVSTDLAVYAETVRDSLGAVTVFPGVTPLLKQLVSRGFVLAVLTGASRVAADIVLRTNDLHDHFLAVRCGDEVAEPKPSPAGLHDLCRALGVPASASVYVGDTPTDMECAERAGAVGILAAWGHRNRVGSADEAALAAREPADLTALVEGLCARRRQPTQRLLDGHP